MSKTISTEFTPEGFSRMLTVRVHLQMLGPAIFIRIKYMINVYYEVSRV